MRKVLNLGLLGLVFAGAAVLTMSPEPAYGFGCSARPSGAPSNLTCTLDPGSGCNASGWCSCNYTCV
jgi:hypothetical protein